MFFLSCASAPSSEARAAWRLASAPRSAAASCSRSSSTSTSPALTARSTSTLSTLMMPLAFDLISTLVIGSTLPVATTDSTIVPRSTVAIFDGSIVVDAPLIVETPHAPTTITAAPTTPMLSFFEVFICECPPDLRVDEQTRSKVAGTVWVRQWHRCGELDVVRHGGSHDSTNRADDDGGRRGGRAGVVDCWSRAATATGDCSGVPA